MDFPRYSGLDIPAFGQSEQAFANMFGGAQQQQDEYSEDKVHAHY